MSKPFLLGRLPPSPLPNFMQRDAPPLTILSKSWLIWLVTALFYAYEFIHRVAPSVAIPETLHDFGMRAIDLGHLSSFYFYAYALFQIPAGLLCDKFGVRFLLTLACLVVTFGSFLMTFTHTLELMYLSRCLVGAGSAFAFVGCLKIAANWFPEHLFPFIVGITNVCGMLGAILGGEPLAHLVTHFGWRQAFAILSWLGLILSGLLLLIVRTTPSNSDKTAPPPHSVPQFLGQLSQVFFSKQIWLLGLYGCFLVAPVATFAELWGVPFLESAYLVTRQQSAGLIRYVFLGIAVGGPAIGWLSAKIPHYQKIMASCTLLALICFISVLYWPHLSLTQIKILFFGYGLFTSNMLLCFSLATFSYPKPLQGAVIGLINMIVMAGGAIFQPIVGKILDLALIKQQTFSLQQLSVSDFQWSLVVLPGCLVLALCLTPWLKPKKI